MDTPSPGGRREDAELAGRAATPGLRAWPRSSRAALTGDLGSTAPPSSAFRAPHFHSSLVIFSPPSIPFLSSFSPIFYFILSFPFLYFSPFHFKNNILSLFPHLFSWGSFLALFLPFVLLLQTSLLVQARSHQVRTHFYEPGFWGRRPSASARSPASCGPRT